MFDQSFSAKNLRIISEIENRRGSNRSLEFFPTVYDATEILKERIRDTKQFRAAHRHAYSADDQAIFDDLKADRETARKARDEELLTCLSNVSQVISQKGFRISIRQVAGPKGKSVYVIPDTPKDLTAQCYYAIKQISRNISRIYKVQQANRNQIIGHLGDALSDGFPYHVIKLDVQEFYERIDHEALLSKLKADQLLSATTMRLIERLLWDYASLAGTPGRGLPRGVGLSAILSELYMREVDANISSISEVAFYARYVDDIIVLFAPTKASKTDEFRESLVKELTAKRLTVNAVKSKEAPPETSLTYLGYSFKNVCKKSCEVFMSDEKHAKYKKRLNACFVRYHRQRAKRPKKAYRLLVKRIQYLTANTQLTHSKQNAFVGIYFSNPHLTNLDQLTQLDDLLAQQIANLTHSASLQAKLERCSFKNGYTQQIFRRFHRDGEFAEITKAWRYGQ
ncbi:antiviral reverse transcriptase Drt3a [Aliiroseovarius lamellibrachiae]|uniref:antiviral reverse transcriptase Drt3a n=1 Tax=Aliiroseovarius lamellibrachiae TaxID=1924933 RepID=UPI001BE0ACC8|nr:antiviral reverse transcriptase Drt3a [Aliiroseovarius lamellibrachiae]MBT2130624.1 RNA-directed DNA polymerase [Aliiroseovarius lamellibrachiae]